MEFRLDCKPNDKQKLFLTDTHKYVGYGGARGGGKSWAVQRKAILMSLGYSGLTTLLLRKTFAELQHNHIEPILKLVNPLIKSGFCKYRATDKVLYFGNGSKLIFGYCDTSSDINRYQGQEYDIIFIDEATHHEEAVWDALRACVRGVNGLPKRIYLTCNPGGVGHAWVKRLFVDREYRSGECPEDYSFIKATVYDNTVLMETQPDYVAQLEALPDDLKQAWLYGEWDVFSGQFFPEWDSSIHICKPFAIPDSWRTYRAMDYGLDMLASYLCSIAPDGDVYIHHEVYEGRDNKMGANSNGHIVSAAAGRLHDQGDAYLNLAPPDLWTRDSTTGKSQADVFAEHDIVLTKVSNDRVNGWMAVKELLQVKDGKSKLHIFRDCVNLIRCLPLLQFDDKKLNDVATTPHEITHAPDALRYFAVYWTSAPEAKQERKKANWSDDMWEDYYNTDEDGKSYLISKWGSPF